MRLLVALLAWFHRDVLTSVGVGARAVGGGCGSFRARQPGKPFSSTRRFCRYVLGDEVRQRKEVARSSEERGRSCAGSPNFYDTCVQHSSMRVSQLYHRCVRPSRPQVTSLAKGGANSATLRAPARRGLCVDAPRASRTAPGRAPAEPEAKTGQSQAVPRAVFLEHRLHRMGGGSSDWIERTTEWSDVDSKNTGTPRSTCCSSCR
jgi:hypothetical protein